jgi:hypothetical protein
MSRDEGRSCRGEGASREDAFHLIEIEGRVIEVEGHPIEIEGCLFLAFERSIENEGRFTKDV